MPSFRNNKSTLSAALYYCLSIIIDIHIYIYLELLIKVKLLLAYVVIVLFYSILPLFSKNGEFQARSENRPIGMINWLIE